MGASAMLASEVRELCFVLGSYKQHQRQQKVHDPLPLSFPLTLPHGLGGGWCMMGVRVVVVVVMVVMVCAWRVVGA